MRLRLLGIAVGAALCLVAVPASKAQSSCVSVGTTEQDAYGIQYYTVTNDCAIAIEGVFTTKAGGSYSFGPLAPRETSVMQATDTGIYRHYDCGFPKLPRAINGFGDWDGSLPNYNSDPAEVVCQ